MSAFRVASFDVGTKNMAFCVLDIAAAGSQLPAGDGTIPRLDAELTSPSQSRVNLRNSVCIVRWGALSLGRKSDSMKQLVSKLTTELANDDLFSGGTVDVVVVEQQASNKRMAVLAHAIQMFFEARSAIRAQIGRPAGYTVSENTLTSVCFLSAKVKHNIYAIFDFPSVKYAKGMTKKQRWARRKEAAVKATRDILSIFSRPADDDVDSDIDDVAREWARWDAVFAGTAKKDDLADAFLQGLYYVKETTIF